MSYEKPECDCGEDLIYFSQHFYDIRRKIRKDGQLYKYRNLFAHGGFMHERLICEKCSDAYEVDMDSKGRIFKGEKIDM